MQHLEAFLGDDALHLVVLDVQDAHRPRRARLRAARALPALVEQVGVERPGLGQLTLFVPVHGAVGTVSYTHLTLPTIYSV